MGITDHELLRFARLAAAVARRATLRPGRFARPAYAPAALFAALLLRDRLRLTYRGLEDLLRLSGQLRRVFGLRVVPDLATAWWFARRRVEPGLLDAALAETVRRARSGAEKAAQAALDSPACSCRTRPGTSRGGPSATAASAAG